MAGIKERLEAAGYDTSGMDEKALLGKLDQAGYDTSSLGTSKPEQPGFIDTVKNQVMSNLGPMGLAGKAEDVIQGVANKAGDYAEKGLQEGVRMSPAAPIAKADPGVAKAAGTMIKATPTIVQAAMPVGEATEAANSSTLRKALTPGLRDVIGAAKGDAEQAAITAENAAQGIVKPGVQRIATPTALGKRLGVPAGERNLQGIVDHFNEKFAAGVKPAVQDLVDLKSIINQAEKRGEIVWKDTSGALIAKAGKSASDLLNKSVKGRAALASEFAKIAKVQKQLANLAKYAGYGTGGAGILGGLAAGYKAVKGL